MAKREFSWVSQITLAATEQKWRLEDDGCDDGKSEYPAPGTQRGKSPEPGK